MMAFLFELRLATERQEVYAISRANPRALLGNLTPILGHCLYAIGTD